MSVNRITSLLVMGIWILAACQPTLPSATPIPTPILVDLQISPALRPWQTRLQGCLLADPTLGVTIQEIPRSSMRSTPGGIRIQFGSQGSEGSFASDLGRLELHIVAHPEVPVTSLSLDILREIYTGEMSNWTAIPTGDPAGAELPVQPWTYPANDDLRQAFEEILGISGDSSRSEFTAPNPEALLEAVMEQPGAIGFLPESWDTGSAQTITLEGEETPLETPVVALTEAEPTGKIRGLIACLQQPSAGE